MEDPFSSLTSQSQSPVPDELTEGSPFEGLSGSSRSRRNRSRTIYSIFTVGILLLGVWFVPRALSGDQTTGANQSIPSVTQNSELSTVVAEPVQENTDSEDAGILDPEDGDLYSAPPNLDSFIERVTGSTVIVECAKTVNDALVDVGSGFIIDVADFSGTTSDGLAIVTNHHVVDNCTEGRGSLAAGSDDIFSEVQVLGYDIANDLALLSIGSLGLNSLPISVDIAPGQWVMTSGSPLGIESNVTFGQVTSLGVTSETPGADMIASDAVIGPGNSGGPLVNSRGEVLAVNSAIIIDMTGISVSVPLTHLCISILKCATS